MAVREVHNHALQARPENTCGQVLWPKGANHNYLDLRQTIVLTTEVTRVDVTAP